MSRPIRAMTPRAVACLDEYEGSYSTGYRSSNSNAPVQEKQQPFLIMPTSCTGPLQTSVEAEAWEADRAVHLPEAVHVLQQHG